MTLFESIFALISIVTSLALAQLITGVVNVARRIDRAKISATHAAWVWLAFVLVIGNWAALFGAQADPDWPPGRILLWLLAMVSLYAFTALVLPQSRASEAIDLKQFERRYGRSYIVAHNIFAVCGLLLIVGVRGFDLEYLRLAVFPLGALVLGLIAMWATRPWLKAAIAASLAINGSVMTLGLLASMSS
ncbi:MAG TPA: hypothetical protein VFS87_09935 [Qipengyuania sp.]|nr:hypothetical protein [Qipengyuania sp.]